MFAKLIAAFVALSITGTILAQQTAAPVPGIKRTILQKVEVPGTNYEAISAPMRLPLA